MILCPHFADGCEPADESPSSHQRLGPSGLALHYANIVIQIDTLVSDYLSHYVVYSPFLFQDFLKI